MNKRPRKRLDRQASRAKAWVELSAPDVRTPKQSRAPREISRTVPDRNNDPHAHYSTPTIQTHAGVAAPRAAKPEAGS